MNNSTSAEGQYVTYLDMVANRLRQNGYKVDLGKEVGEYQIQLFARRYWSGRDVVFQWYVFYSEDSGLDTVKKYFAQLGEHARTFETIPLRSMFSFPVLVSQGFGDEAREFVRSFDGLHYPWGYWYRGIEHPVLIGLREREIVHHEQKGFAFWWGRMDQKRATSLATQYLSFT